MKRLAIVLLALAGCNKSASHPPPTPERPDMTTPLVSSLTVSDVFNDFTRPQVFSLVSTRTLYVRLSQYAAPMPPTTTLHLTFINPAGDVFFEDHVAYTTATEPTMVTTERSAVPVEALPIDPDGHTIIRAVPIVGTIFTRIPQREGAWGVTAELDGIPGKLSTTITLMPAN